MGTYSSQKKKEKEKDKIGWVQLESTINLFVLIRSFPFVFADYIFLFTSLK